MAIAARNWYEQLVRRAYRADAAAPTLRAGRAALESIVERTIELERNDLLAGQIKAMHESMVKDGYGPRAE